MQPKRLQPRRLSVLIYEQVGLCWYCDRPMTDGNARATIDHRVPLGRGGANTRENQVAACYGCNRTKGILTEEEFLPLIGLPGAAQALQGPLQAAVRMEKAERKARITFLRARANEIVERAIRHHRKHNLPRDGYPRDPASRDPATFRPFERLVVILGEDSNDEEASDRKAA